jgi:DNA-directed RNA polymerase specialized sigma24 family protein
MHVSRPTMNPSTADAQQMTDLLQRVDAGDDTALAELIEIVEPDIRRIASSLAILRRKGRTQPDDLAQVRMYALLRLHHSRGKSLRRFLTRHDAAAAEIFPKWFCKLVRYAAMDHLRAEEGRRPVVSSSVNGKLQPSKSDVWRPSDDPESAIDSAVRRFVGVTAHLRISEVTAFIRTSFSDTEIEALRLYLNDVAYKDIAAKLALPSTQDAVRLVRALKERLRVRFRSEDVFGPDAR